MAERRDESLAAVIVDISDPLVSCMNDTLQEIEGGDSCTIYRVHPFIRVEDSGAYDPKIISIGPFHKEKLSFQPMERLKWRFLRDLISRDPNNTLDKYIEEVRSLASQAATCYSAELDPTSDSFVKMLVLDGCFIIEFLLKCKSGKNDDNLYDVNWNLPLLRNDLLLLENQLPFFVIQSLFDLSVIPDDLSVLARNYLTSKAQIGQEVPNRIHHLLHLYHSTLRPSSAHDGRSAANSSLLGNIFNAGLNNIWSFRMIYHGMSVVNSCLLGIRKAFGDHKWVLPVQNSLRSLRGIPSTTDLLAAGILFKKKESMCMLDVTFRYGVMEMPLLSIQAATMPLFRNLVAFEQCCPEAGSHFTSYVPLLNNLIDKSEDVIVLEAYGILESKLGSKEVWTFFNSLGHGVYLDYHNHYLEPLLRDVRKYTLFRTNRWWARLYRWIARVKQDSYSNRWSISLITAIVILVLAAIQSFFAVYSYFKPPKGPN